MIRIAVTTAGKPEKEIVCRGEPVTLGRAPSNTLVFADEHVSWQHGQLAFRSGRCWYRDLHTTNGSYLEHGGERVTLGGKDWHGPIEVGDLIILASDDNAIAIREMVEDVVVEGSFGTVVMVGDFMDPKRFEESLSGDSEALRHLLRLIRELCAIHTAESVKRHIAKMTQDVFKAGHRTIVFETHGDTFQPFVLAPTSADQRADEAIPKSATLLSKVVSERRGLVFVVLEDSIRALASQTNNLAMRESARSFMNKALLCCPLAYGEDCYGVIQVESAPSPTPEEVFSRRDLELATLFGHLAAARLHDLEHQERQLYLQRKATVGVITSWIGHDLGNLLQTPMSSASVIPILVRESRNQELEKVLLRNRACIEVMSVILHEITDVAKDRAQEFRECDIMAELQGTVEYLRGIAPEHLAIDVRSEPNVPTVTCHPVAIQRLVLNLIMNAADVIAESDRSHEGKISLTCQYLNGTDEVEIRIADNGPGIPADVLSEMRFIYNRIQDSKDGLHDLEMVAEKSTSRKMKKGKGLGFLFVCQTVFTHRGKMDIETGPDGSSFSIRIPRGRRNGNQP